MLFQNLKWKAISTDDVVKTIQQINFGSHEMVKQHWIYICVLQAQPSQPQEWRQERKGVWRTQDEDKKEEEEGMNQSISICSMKDGMPSPDVWGKGMQSGSALDVLLWQ